MNKIGVIVDGAGDYAALRTRLVGVCVVKTDGPRGHNVTPAQIATGSIKQIEILRMQACTHVVIVTDFETRATNYGEFCLALTSELKRLNVAIQVFCAVPNRMIENWYLADIKHIATRKSFLQRVTQQRRYEGTHGKDELKRLFKRGHSYNEVKHGPQLFKLLRFNEARQNSESLERFLKLLESYQDGTDR